MKTVRRILLLGTMVLVGCQTAHDVAVTSFRVIDAPANYVRRKIDRSEATTTTTTTTVTSDVVTPGQTVTASPRRDRPAVAQNQPGPAASPRPPRTTTTEKPKASPSPGPRTVVSPPEQLPTAKPVPGKPGYVFSPYDPSGGYVDVNGYPSGAKVKDPYSGKVFLVP